MQSCRFGAANFHEVDEEFFRLVCNLRVRCSVYMVHGLRHVNSGHTYRSFL